MTDDVPSASHTFGQQRSLDKAWVYPWRIPRRHQAPCFVQIVWSIETHSSSVIARYFRMVLRWRPKRLLIFEMEYPSRRIRCTSWYMIHLAKCAFILTRWFLNQRISTNWTLLLPKSGQSQLPKSEQCYLPVTPYVLAVFSFLHGTYSPWHVEQLC